MSFLPELNSRKLIFLFFSFISLERACLVLGSGTSLLLFQNFLLNDESLGGSFVVDGVVPGSPAWSDRSACMVMISCGKNFSRLDRRSLDLSIFRRRSVSGRCDSSGELLEQEVSDVVVDSEVELVSMRRCQKHQRF